MNEKTSAPVELAIAHVLFMDIVGYSKLTTKEQNAAVATLNELVQKCEPFQVAEKADRLLKIPTGDGMALVFYRSPEEPVQCAVALTKLLKQHPALQVRMGVHSGSVSGVVDVTGRANVAGAGINIAQRVMDCGDGGHILLSKHAADDLGEYERWRPILHDLGPCEVKHGVKVHIVNAWNDDAGNSRLPTKLRAQRQRAARRRWTLLGAAVALVAIVTSGVLIWRAREKSRIASLSRSVAILPFENLSTKEENAIFAGGVHREVLTNLAKVADLKVISRTSVMRYKPSGERNLKQIAQELGVNYVVEGSVQREADHVRVTAELINADTDSHVWAETYDGQVADVLGIQSEIAQRISNQLGAKLSPRESTDLAARPTKDLAAFENYIRARGLMETPDTGDNREEFQGANLKAVQLLEQAVARDPKFVASYWALAEANTQLYRTSEGETPQYRERAEAALKEAQRLAPNAGETVYAEARVIYYGYHDFKRALATLEQAAKSLPNNADISLTRALLYRRFGRWQESLAQFRRAQELNPQEPSAYFNGWNAALALRWYDDADGINERMMKLLPRFTKPAQVSKIISLRLRGDVEAARKEMKTLDLNVQSDFFPLFHTAFWDRNFGEARRLVNEAARFHDIDRERWEGEVRLAAVGQPAVDRNVALEAEKRLDEELKNPSLGEREGVLVETLTCVKLILGKKEEAVHLCEASVAKHPVSEDALVNITTLRWLAYVYVFAGEDERALQTFAKLVQTPSGFWYGPLKFDPVLDKLRHDPRFEDILKQAQVPFPRVNTII